MIRYSVGVRYVIYVFVILLWVFSIYKIGLANLDNANLWFDEAGQFWMSKGLNHYSEPFSKTGGLFDVISQNNKWNLDPGGFTVILHYWSAFNNSPFWLRLLPFIFFIGSCVVVAIVVYIVSNSTEIALFSLFYLPIFVKGDILNFGLELRAYSMEYFGVLLSLLLFILYLKKNSFSRLLLLNIVMAVFCTSRYSFIVFAFSISVASLFVSNLSKKKLFCYLPLLLTVLLIFLISTRFQFAVLKSPEYTSMFMFKSLSIDATKRIIFNNILSANSKYVFVLIVISIGLFLYSDYKEKSKRNFLLVGLVLLIYNLLLCFLSFRGIHPWDVTIRWNLTMQILNVFALLYLISFVLSETIISKDTNKLRFAYLLIFLVFVTTGKSLFNIVGNLSMYSRPSYDSVYQNIESVNLKDSDVVYVAYNELATWRYLNEYGPLKNRYNYPVNTVFGRNGDNVSDIMKSNYIIQSGSVIEGLQKLQDKGVIIEKTVAKPNRIFLVKKI